MKNDLLAKYAEDKNFNIKIKKVWRDSYSNLLVVFEALGKKYSAIGKDDLNSNDWNHFHGIGSSKKTKDMPVGRGDYLIGDKILLPIAEKIIEALESQAPQEEVINNKAGISWAPKNKTEKENLAALITKCEEINSYLSGIGMIYSGGDKLIYGEDVDASDVLNWKIPITVPSEPPAAKVRSTSPSGKPSSSQGIFGSSAPRWIGKNGYVLGPQYHQARGLGNWSSDNAWDIEGSPGTQVYSISRGTVSKMHESGTSNPKIYGTQISISGDSGYPSVFYTHLEGAAISPGDRVEVGTPIAKIKAPLTAGMPPHVHVGLSNGAISDLVTEDGKFIIQDKKLIS